MKRFQVIWLDGACVGESDTLRGAKQVATKHRVFGNGIKKPRIYRACDCYIDETRGITPKDGATPASVWLPIRLVWEDFYVVFGEM